MRLLFIGDIMGNAGQEIVLNWLPDLLREEQIDFTIANGENATGGFGLSKKHFQRLIDCGVDAITMGNHTWDNKDIYRYIDHEPRIVRPANYHASLPGRGWRTYSVGEEKLVLINLIGRVFMKPCDCPFATVDHILSQVENEIVVVDFHGEATSEKVAMGWHLDGKVAAVVGTHTHVQTNDARILPRGTGYLTDVGMTGPRDSVLGVEKEIILERFITGFSPRFETARGDRQFNAVLFDIGEDHRCQEVKLLNFWEPALS